MLFIVGGWALPCESRSRGLAELRLDAAAALRRNGEHDRGAAIRTQERFDVVAVLRPPSVRTQHRLPLFGIENLFPVRQVCPRALFGSPAPVCARKEKGQRLLRTRQMGSCKPRRSQGEDQQRDLVVGNQALHIDNLLFEEYSEAPAGSALLAAELFQLQALLLVAVRDTPH